MQFIVLINPQLDLPEISSYEMGHLLKSLRSSHQRCSVKKVILRNFAKFTGKHLCQSPFLNKVASYRPKACNFIKKETLVQMFFREFSKFLVTRFLQNTSGRLRLIVVHHSMLRNLRVHEEDNACSERLSTFSKFRIDIVSN